MTQAALSVLLPLDHDGVRLEIRSAAEVATIELSRRLAHEVAWAMAWRELFPPEDLPLAEDGGVVRRADGAVEVISAKLDEVSEPTDLVEVDFRLSLLGGQNNLVVGLHSPLQGVDQLGIVEPDAPALERRVRLGVRPLPGGPDRRRDTAGADGEGVPAPEGDQGSRGSPQDCARVLENGGVEVGGQYGPQLGTASGCSEEGEAEAAGDDVAAPCATHPSLADRCRLDRDGRAAIQNEPHSELSMGGVDTPMVGRPAESRHARVGGDVAHRIQRWSGGEVRAADLRPDLADLLATAAEPAPAAEACA